MSIVWWSHEKRSSLLAICRGNVPVTDGFSPTNSLVVSRNKLLNKQSSGRWFLRQWRLCGVTVTLRYYVIIPYVSWDHFRCSRWRHQMETFSALLAICAGNSPVTGEFPAQRPVTRSFDVFFDLRLNKRLSKQSRGWWFETPSRPLWRHWYVQLQSSRQWYQNVLVVAVTQNMNKTASFQKEAMRTQVALYFFMKWNLYRVVSLCLNKQNVQNRQVEKSLLL